MNSDFLVILIAPNVGEQMGGGSHQGPADFSRNQANPPAHYPDNSRTMQSRIIRPARLARCALYQRHVISVFLWKTKIFRMLLDPWFCLPAIRKAEQIAEAQGLVGYSVVIHQSLPNSPVMPRFVSNRHANVFGPVNGNIYYPPIFRKDELVSASFRRIFHMRVQQINRLLFHGLSRANAVLCAGGYRTRKSLVAAGCPERILVDRWIVAFPTVFWTEPEFGIAGSILDSFITAGSCFTRARFWQLKAWLKQRFPYVLTSSVRALN